MRAYVSDVQVQVQVQVQFIDSSKHKGLQSKNNTIFTNEQK